MDFTFTVISTWGHHRKCCLVDCWLMQLYISKIWCHNIWFCALSLLFLGFDAPMLIKTLKINLFCVQKAGAVVKTRDYLFIWQYNWFVFVILCLKTKLSGVHMQGRGRTQEGGCDDYHIRPVLHRFHLALFCLSKKDCSA